MTVTLTIRDEAASQRTLGATPHSRMLRLKC